MSFTRLIDIQECANNYIQDRLNSARIDIVTFLQDMMYKVDGTIYKEARDYIYQKQLEIFTARSDYDINEILNRHNSNSSVLASVTSENSSSYNGELRSEIDCNTIDLTEKDQTVSIDTDSKKSSKRNKKSKKSIIKNETDSTVSLTSSPEDIDINNSKLIQVSKNEADLILIKTSENTTTSSSNNTSVKVVKNKSDGVTSSSTLIKNSETKHTVNNITNSNQNSTELEIEKKIKESKITKQKTEQSFNITHSNGTDIEVTTSTTKKYSDVVTKTNKSEKPVTEMIYGKSKPLQQDSKQISSNKMTALIKSIPSNPAVFWTISGNRIEIPILDRTQINPFVDLIAERFIIDPSFNEYKNINANTRLKAAYEALKQLDANQAVVDSILNEL